MAIHADDLHTKCLNFNRHITSGYSTAFPKLGTDLARAYHTVVGLNLDEKVLAEQENMAMQMDDPKLREAIATITVPTPDHMNDMEYRYLNAGGSSTFVSC